MLIDVSTLSPLNTCAALVQDLVGLRVFMQQGGEELGKVVDIFDGTGALWCLPAEDGMRATLSAR